MKLLFPTVPTETQWEKLTGNMKAQWLLLGALQITSCFLVLLTLLFA